MRSNDNEINSDGISWMSWHDVDKKVRTKLYALDMLELIKGKYLVLIDFIINIFFNLINSNKNNKVAKIYYVFNWIE